MAHALSITDGTTTVSLSSTTCMLLHYVPRAPKFDAKTLAYQDVTEPIEIMVYAASTSLLQTAIAGIERVLFAVVERQANRTGPIPYLQFQADGDAAAWRSEILNYQFDPFDDANLAFPQAKVSYRLVITRRPYWEGARTALPLTNGNGTNVTAGLTIYNHDDSGTGHDNWATIAAADVVGTMPAPLEIKLTNNVGSSRSYDRFHVANNTYGTGLAHILLGSSCLTSYGPTITTSGWHNFRWTVPTASLNLLAGRFVRILGRFSALPSGQYPMQASLWQWSGLSQVAYAPQTYTSTAYTAGLQDGGALAMPNAGYSSGWADHVLQLSIYTSTSQTITVSYVQLTPAETLRYTTFRQLSYSVPNGAAVVYDGIENLIYYDSGGTKYPIYQAMYEPVHVVPNVAQRLLCLWDGTGILTDDTMSLQAWYRPRRTTF